MPPKKSTRKTPWEIAKPLLEKDYLNGVVNDAMKPKDVWAMKKEFMDVKYENFRSNFWRMKKTIRLNKDRATEDEDRFCHDVAIYPLAKDTPGFWDGLEAQELLKADIEAKRHKGMNPLLFWKSCP